jgi:hypothetical protein
VEDRNLLSGKGLGHAFDFAFALSARLLGDETPFAITQIIFITIGNHAPRYTLYRGTRITELELWINLLIPF